MKDLLEEFRVRLKANTDLAEQLEAKGLSTRPYGWIVFLPLPLLRELNKVLERQHGD